MNDYYVYVYIDPRNNEEFYYGKGRGDRKNAHLGDKSDKAKAQRIRAIHKEGLDPVIRIIARGLEEKEALLIEKTLLWKLGKWTTNIATGHFASKFRPHNTLHKELTGFDFENGFYYFNVGDGPHRKWEDFVRHGYISAGQGARRGKAMLGFSVGDLFAAYLRGRGFVGIGRIVSAAVMIRDLRVDGASILKLPLNSRAGENCNDRDLSEYACGVKWIATVPRTEARKQSSPKLFTSQLIRASLDRQPETVMFLEREFAVSIRELLAGKPKKRAAISKHD